MRPARKSYFCSSLLITLGHSFPLQLADTVPTHSVPTTSLSSSSLSPVLFSFAFSHPFLFSIHPAFHPSTHSLAHSPSRTHTFIPVEHTHTVTVHSTIYTNPHAPPHKVIPLFPSPRRVLGQHVYRPKQWIQHLGPHPQRTRQLLWPWHHLPGPAQSTAAQAHQGPLSTASHPRLHPDHWRYCFFIHYYFYFSRRGSL